jgi:hypothetical protein
MTSVNSSPAIPPSTRGTITGASKETRARQQELEQSIMGESNVHEYFGKASFVPAYHGSSQNYSQTSGSTYRQAKPMYKKKENVEGTKVVQPAVQPQVQPKQAPIQQKEVEKEATSNAVSKVSDIPKEQPQVVTRKKYEMCKNFREKGFCKYGDKCLFAHGDAELTKRVYPTPAPLIEQPKTEAVIEAAQATTELTSAEPTPIETI